MGINRAVCGDRHNVRHAINELYKLPPELASTEQAKLLYEYGCVTEMDIVGLIYRPVEPQGASKTYDFSRSSLEKRWQEGTADARTVLHASPWRAPAPKELGVRVFDVLRDDLLSKNRQFADACREPRECGFCNRLGEGAPDQREFGQRAQLDCKTMNRTKRFPQLRNKWLRCPV